MGKLQISNNKLGYRSYKFEFEYEIFMCRYATKKQQCNSRVYYIVAYHPSTEMHKNRVAIPITDYTKLLYTIVRMPDK